MIHEKRGGALRGLRINREILILRKPPIDFLMLASISASLILRSARLLCSARSCRHSVWCLAHSRRPLLCAHLRHNSHGHEHGHFIAMLQYWKYFPDNLLYRLIIVSLVKSTCIVSKKYFYWIYMYRNPLPSVPESGTYRVSGRTYSVIVGMLFAVGTLSAQILQCRSPK